MTENDFWGPRRCIAPVTDIVLEAADNLSKAADADIAGDIETARFHIRAADTSELRQRVQSIWGAMSVEIHRIRKVDTLDPMLPKEERIKQRMPNSKERKLIRERDGWHCRFCGSPVIDVIVRDHFRKKYPDAFLWGSRNSQQHSGFQNLWLQYDHVIPHSIGGNNSIDNVVTTCAPCNYGRGSYTLEEMGLMDPREFEPVKTDWDGLSRLFTS